MIKFLNLNTVNNAQNIEIEALCMLIVIAVAALQVIPILYLIIWGFACGKITEFYLWVRSALTFRVRFRFIDKGKLGGTDRNFQIYRQSPEQIGPRRVSLELRLEKEGRQKASQPKEIHDIIIE